MIDSNPQPAVVLIVDDDAVIREVLRRIAQHVVGNRYQVLASAHGADALTQSAQHAVALLITDYRLGGMDGIQLTAAIKGRSPATRAILIAGCPTPEVQSQAQLMGVDAWLPKPFTLDTLRQTMRVFLPNPSPTVF